MTEAERQALLAMALDYWFPIRWEQDGSWYERANYVFFGDVTSGGVTITALKDAGDPVNIDFSNEDCYGEARLDAAAALTKFTAAFGS